MLKKPQFKILMKPLFLFIFIFFYSLEVKAKTDKYRLIWNSNPQSSVTIAWCKIDGNGAKVHYGEFSKIEEGKDYPLKKDVHRKTLHLDIRSRFARIDGLKPNTVYAFVVKDDNSQSKQFTFLEQIL